jgi:hypothetical protein
VSTGTVPVVMCDSEYGCGEYFLDHYEMGVSNWRAFVPHDWQYDPYDDKPDLCPEHVNA